MKTAADKAWEKMLGRTVLTEAQFKTAFLDGQRARRREVLMAWALGGLVTAGAALLLLLCAVVIKMGWRILWM